MVVLLWIAAVRFILFETALVLGKIEHPVTFACPIAGFACRRGSDLYID